MRRLLKFYFLISICFFFANNLYGQGLKLLLSSQKLKNTEDIIRAYSPDGMPLIGWSQLQDSLNAAYERMAMTAYRKEMSPYDMYPNYKLIQKTLDNFSKIEECAKTANCNSNYTYWVDFLLYSLFCVEHKHWSDWLLNLSRASKRDYHAAFQKYILPKIPGNKQKAVRFLLDIRFLEEMSIDTRKKDNPQNIKTIQLLDSLWNIYRQKDIEQALQTTEIIVVNPDKKQDTLHFYISKAREKELNEEVAEIFLEKYTKVALYFEDLRKVKNGHIVPMNNFLKEKIIPDNSAYLKALYLSQYFMNKGRRIPNRRDLQLAYLNTTDNNYCEKLETFFLDEIVNTYSDGYMDSLGTPLPAHYLLFKNYADKLGSGCSGALKNEANRLVDSIVKMKDSYAVYSLLLDNYGLSTMYPTKEWDALLHKQAEEAILFLKNQENTFVALQLLNRYRYSFSRKSLLNWDSLMLAQIQKAKTELLTEKDTTLFKNAVGLLDVLSAYLSPDALMDFTEEVKSYLSETNWKLVLDYETALLINSRFAESEKGHCKQLIAWKSVLQYYETIEADTSKFLLPNGRKYSRLQILEDAWSACETALSGVFSITAPERRFDRKTYNYVYIPGKQARNIHGNKLQQSACPEDSIYALIPAFIQNDQSLLDRNVFLEKKLESNSNYITLLTFTLQKILKNPQLQSLEHQLSWEVRKNIFLARYISFDSEADCNTQLYAAFEKLRRQYDAHPAVYWVYDAMIQIQKDSAALYDIQYPAATTAFRWNKRKAVQLRKMYSLKHPKAKYIGHEDLFPITFLGLEYPDAVAPDRPFQILVHAENVDTFNLRIRRYHFVDTFYTSEIPEWDENFEVYNSYFDTIYSEVKRYYEEEPLYLKIPYMGVKDYHRHSLELLVPALKPGKYEIEIDNNAKHNYSMQTIEIEVNPIWLLARKERPQVWTINYLGFYDYFRRYYLLDRNSGAALENVTILYRLAQERYDKNGNYTSYGVPEKATIHALYLADTKKGIRLPDKQRIFAVVYKGDTIEVSPDFGIVPELKSLENVHCEIFTDRAVYRSAQELKFKVVLFTSKEGTAMVYENHSSTIGLYNTKGVLVATNTFFTNEFGSAEGTFYLKEELMGGVYYLRCEQQEKMIRLEAYKRPTFDITFAEDRNLHVLGDSICFEGTVKALAGYPMQDADVKYRLNLELDAPWYEVELDKVSGYDRNGNDIILYPSQKQLFNAQIKTDSLGRFRACFQTEVVKYHSPSMNYNYNLFVDVSDQKGETQTATQTLTLRREAYTISILNDELIDAGQRNPIEIAVRNSSDLPVTVDMDIKLYRLKTPTHFKDYRLWDKPTDTLISAMELEKQLPYAPHWREDDAALPYGEIVNSITLTAKRDYSYVLPKNLAEGKYLLRVEVRDSTGRQADNNSRFGYIDWNSPKMPWAQAFFAHSPKDTYRQDENFHIYLGSSYPEGAKMLFYCSRLDSVIYEEWQTVSGKKELQIPLNELPLGEYDYRVYMVLNNRIYQHSGDFTIVSTRPTGKLNVEILEYRKQYEPGDVVEIKLRITDVNKKPIEAELVAGIYDAALEKFAKHSLLFSDISRLRRFPMMSMNGGMSLYSDSQLSLRKSKSFGKVDTIFTYDPESFEDVVQVVTNEAQPSSLSDILRDKPKPGKPKKEKKSILRTDLDETILWMPQAVVYGEDGMITITTTMNDALTRWNALIAVHSKDASSGSAALSFVSNKPLMVQPNVPRFVRQNDSIVLAAILVNQEDKTLKGKLSLSILDAVTKKPLEGFLLEPSMKKFKLAAKKNQGFAWKIRVPDTAKTVLYRIVAKAGKAMDGEEGQLMVLSDKSLEIYQQNISLKGKESKTMPLPQDDSPNNSPVKLKLNVSYNLSWDVLQSLPSLIENPYECSEQLINKAYANALAAYMLEKNPAIAATMENWKNNGKPLPIEFSDPELREKIQMQTPWVFDMGEEDVDRKRFARLLDKSTLESGKNNLYYKLLSRQAQSGGLSWYGGLEADNYITMYVLQVVGHYRKLTGKELLIENNYLTKRAVNYTKYEFTKQYNTWKSIAAMTNADLGKLDIRPEHLNLLYTISFYKDELDTSFSKVEKFVFDLLEKQWQSFEKPVSLGHIALAFYRNGRDSSANRVLDTLLQRSFLNKENGRYWLKDYGYYWYEAPIETQALLIEAFAEIRPEDKALLEQLKTWLLLQREGGSWMTSKATSSAATALMLGRNWLSQNAMPDILLNDMPVSFPEEEQKRNPGKLSKSWQDEQTLRSTKTVTVKNNNETPAYANLTLYTLKPMAAIKATADSSFRVEKHLYRALPDGNWQYLPADSIYYLKRGDRIRLDLHLQVPKYLEYVHLYDQHPAGFEPENSRSDMFYEGGAHYRDVRDGLTNFFFSRLSEGRHVISREFFINNAGAYQSGMATMECMYAPKFKAHTDSRILRAE